ncbi:hypothetical protein [Pedobacter nutrimenti]|uniref:Uncharacterized protein n=1 Tax=Pedobacter nutrimenti TaxID=1241337 RepID=A0A318U668_9SPHI|nr:hypothetical protein [Pedobacter nutrimenti]PYF68421.1 hypothetical protein B0O44_1125 [Pedobacter nutrimenti]
MGRGYKKVEVDLRKATQPLAIYLSSKGIKYPESHIIYSSPRTFYYRNKNPKTMLLIEGIRLAEHLNVSMESLIEDLSNHSISFI